MNKTVQKTLKELVNIESGDELCLIVEGSQFKLYHGSKQVGDDLSLTDLKKISKNATRYGIVQLVDVSQVVHFRLIKITNGYLKLENDIPRAFLHVIHHIQFLKPSQRVSQVGVKV